MNHSRRNMYERVVYIMGRRLYGDSLGFVATMYACPGRGILRDCSHKKV